MSVGQRLEIRQGQSLVMTPQLQQAIKLLQLSNLDLAAYVEHEIEQNPLLERPEASAPEGGENSEGVAGSSEATASDTAHEGEQFSDWSTTPSRGGSFDDDVYSLENVLTKEATLRDHLIDQMNMQISDAGDRLIGLFLIDQVDENGYIKESMQTIADLLACPVDRVEEVLAVLQTFDPVGVCARNLGECLALQLKEVNRLDPAMQTLLDHLDLLGQRDFKQLLKLCGVDNEDLKEMVEEVKGLNPRPAIGFASDPSLTQPPDVLMRPNPAGGWIVELNNATLPRVLVNESYYAKVTTDARNKEEKDYLAERFASANWLVKSLHQRAQTILKVATEIVRRQNEFFEKGIAHLRPLILKDIAEAIEMHESTVSRVTANKFITTPRGLFELKYFFTTAVGGEGEEAHSAEAVRHRIKTLVDAEEPRHVLSDDDIVGALKRDGIDIARRTVAKYREAMKIPSSVQRRREKATMG